MEELRRTFRPEFLNRIDETIVFHALKEEDIKRIVDLMLKDLNKRLAENGLQVEVTDAAKEVLVKEGFDEAYGARPLRRAIQQLLEDQISEDMLAGKFKAGDKVLADAEEGKIVLKKTE